MRDFGIVHTRFWLWAKRNKLNDTEKIIAVYLLSSPHSNSLGCFYQPISYAAEDLGYSIDRVSKGYISLCKKDFINHCSCTNYVHIIKYLIWNPVQNNNHAKGLEKYIFSIPKDCTIISNILKSLYKFGNKYVKFNLLDRVYIGYLKGIGTVSTPYRYIDIDTDIDTEIETEKETKKKFVPPSEQDVIKYFIENGYTEYSAKKAFSFYDIADWVDTKGNKIKNWKQKMIGVWFKYKNKISSATAIQNQNKIIEPKTYAQLQDAERRQEVEKYKALKNERLRDEQNFN